MRDEKRTLHIEGKLWKWELIESVNFPHIKIWSPYGRKYVEAAEYFLLKDEMYIGYSVNIVPSKIRDYITKKLLKNEKTIHDDHKFFVQTLLWN